jgi:hypothetical protein
MFPDGSISQHFLVEQFNAFHVAEDQISSTTAIIAEVCVISFIY